MDRKLSTMPTYPHESRMLCQEDPAWPHTTTTLELACACCIIVSIAVLMAAPHVAVCAHARRVDNCSKPSISRLDGIHCPRLMSCWDVLMHLYAGKLKPADDV